MKVLGVCASTRKGSTEQILDIVLSDNEKLCLYDYDLSFVGSSNKGDFEQVREKILAADVLVFASPCYYDMITPQLLNLIDLLDEDTDAGKLKGKKVAFVTTGSAPFEESMRNAADYMKRVAGIWEAEFLGTAWAKTERSGWAPSTEDLKRAKELATKLA